MPDFIPQPQIPYGSIQAILSAGLQAQRPAGAAAEAGGGIIGSFGKGLLDVQHMKQSLAARKALIDYLQHHIGLREKANKVADLVSQLSRRGLLSNAAGQPGGTPGMSRGAPASTAGDVNPALWQPPAGSNAAPGSPGGNRVPLGDIIRAMGVNPEAFGGGNNLSVTQTPRTWGSPAAAADVTTITPEMAAKFKQYGISVPVGAPASMSHLMTALSNFQKNAMAAENKTDAKNRSARFKATSLSLQQHLAEMNSLQGMVDPSKISPQGALFNHYLGQIDPEEVADQPAQGNGQPSFSDLFSMHMLQGLDEKAP